MTTFIWKAQDQSGATIIREVESDSVEESKSILISEGLTNLKLFQEEVMALSIAGMKGPVSILGDEIKPTAEQRLLQYNKPPLTVWTAIGQGVNHSKVFSGFIIAFCLFLGYKGYIISAIIVACAGLAWLLFIICVSLPLIYYTKLNKAMDWNRWEDAFNLIKRLEINNKLSFIKIPDTELARNRAIALAGSGKLAEAIAEFKSFKDRPDCPSWLHKMHHIGIYNAANKYSESLKCALECIEEHPTPIMFLDLANQLARYHKDAKRAREALNEAEKSTLVETSKFFQIRCRGIIAYLEGDFASAQHELENAIELMEQTPHVPYRDGHISVAKSYLCCVLGKLGDLESAKRLLDEARDYLVATSENGRLAECEAIIGALENHTS